MPFPGVLAVVTHEDVPDVLYGGMVQDRRLFARDTVRFEGDIVAGVAATTAAIADAAAALIEIDYEPLPVVTDFEAALADDATLVHPDWESYDGDDELGSNRNTLGYSTIVKGDADAALAAADVVVKGRYVTDPVQGVPIEPRAVIAQWQGDKLTVWTSTQVPYAARGGVAHTLQIPESNIRIVVPLLGGGFGAKCDFHFEAHVAALARAARRPVKLVFSRREEFFAVGHRREGMVIELETGARSDGTLVARKARLVLDKGAYCGEGGFFAQMAAMHALGPYKLENVHIESSLVYSNNQPSSSIRAPTAPQVCWALEQHMDELASALGMDPVDLRRATAIETGSVTATGQVLEDIAMKETLEKAVELIGYGQELPEDEAIGVAIGWWPCFASKSGAYVKLNPDGSGTIITGAQENGTGSVMAMPTYVAAELGMEPEDFSMLYQDTDAAPWDMGSCGSQTTFNSGRAVIAAAVDLRDQLLDAAAERLEASRDDLELGGGAIFVKGSPDKSVTIAKLAGRGTFHGKSEDVVPDGPEAPAEGCVGRLGLESFHAPQLIAHAVRVRVDRGHRRRPRARGRRCPRLRQDPEQDRSRRPGVRRRRDGHRPGSLGGHPARRRRAPPECPPDRLQARDGLGCAEDRRRVDRDGHAWCRAEGLEGRRRAALRPDGRGDRQRGCEGDRRPRPQAADDPREGLGGRRMSVRRTPQPTVTGFSLSPGFAATCHEETRG